MFTLKINNINKLIFKSSNTTNVTFCHFYRFRNPSCASPTRTWQLIQLFDPLQRIPLLSPVIVVSRTSKDIKFKVYWSQNWYYSYSIIDKVLVTQLKVTAALIENIEVSSTYDLLVHWSNIFLLVQNPLLHRFNWG